MTRTRTIRLNRGARRRTAGLSLVELMISLAIIALLLTATMVAIDASFRAYAAAAESASTQASTRLVVHRLLTMVRTSTAHGPLSAADVTPDDPPIASVDNDTIESRFLVLQNQHGQFVRLEHDPEAEQLIVKELDGPTGPVVSEQPLLGGVSECRFLIRRRMNRDGVLVLQRGSIEMTVRPSRDNTLAIEAGDTAPIEVVASTMPRRLD